MQITRKTSLVPVTGMYFLHPDHLGSITMITDGHGNVVSGGNNGGKSHTSYRPYGEILRTDSGGPDISKFKFTGQEEDKESSLMYYKARYYDPMIGKFLQADSVIMPESTYGMNRYMYVEGNPVRYGDDSGHKRHNGDRERQIQYFTAAVIGFQNDGLRGAALGLMSMQNAKHRSWESKMRGNAQKRPEKYNAKDALADVARGFQRIAHDVNHFNDHAIQDGFKWAMGGAQRAADTFNLLLFGRRHNENTIWHKIGRSENGRFWQNQKESFIARLYRNRHCVSLGVQALAFYAAGVGVAASGLAGSTTLAGGATSGGLGLLGISHSPELIYAINIIFNINSLAGSGPIGIIQSAQQCHLRSL